MTPMVRLLKSILLCASVAITACSQTSVEPPKTIGEIQIWNEMMTEIISPEAQIEVLADGFQWSEGPAWDPDQKQIYISDVPQNKAYVWSEIEGLRSFLDPSGIPNEDAAGFREAGTNGLIVMPDGKLLMANHGKRSLELIDVETKKRTPVVTSFDGKRFNSPNDIARAKDGTLFFTDPPYGLKDLNASPLKEMAFNGIYKLSPDGIVSLIDDRQTFPNGIALSPDEQTLYVAVSDSAAPKIMAYTKDSAGNFSSGALWFDAKPYQHKGLPGLPDGMAVADSGHVFATGPGGVFILNPDGTPIGQIHTGKATANCTFGDDGKTLYITAGDTLVRVPLLQGVAL